MTLHRPVSMAAAISATALIIAASVGLAQSPTAAAPAGKVLKVVGAYATPIEEPWDGVIDTALKAATAAGRIDYSFQDDIGYTGNMEPTLRQIAADSPDVIFGDAFGLRDAVQAVAADYPDIAFVFGSDGGPADPNLSVFDNWIHEPAYLAGMLAGGMTRSNIIGVVGAMPIPEVNRLINAYIEGAQSVNDKVQVKVSFINNFDDPATAHEAALAQIGAGADVIYAERDGAIQAAKEKGVLAIGNMSDQSAEAPDNVITSVVWDMQPTVNYVLDQVSADAYTAQDLGQFSSYGKGGAKLATVNAAVGGGIPQDLLDKVTAKEQDIASGVFRVDVNEGTPAGSVDVTASPAASPSN
jgi:basic membrane protein A